MVEAAKALSDIDALKIPPHSIEAEQAVLGGLLIDSNAWDQIADRVSSVDFYRRDHRLIYDALADLAEKSGVFDVVTVSEYLESRNSLNDAGGLVYLGRLAKETPSAANIKAYADIVRERSILRQLIEIGTGVADSAYNPDGRESKELLEQAERAIFQIADQGARGKQGFNPLKSLLTKAVDRIDELFHQEGTITGIETGFSDFDDMTSGMQPGDLVIVAGRPSMGKCIVSGSRIVDPNSGKMQRIDDMVANQTGGLFTLQNDFKFTLGEPSAFVDDGIKPVFKVTLASGREISTTITHPFLTMRGWQKLEQVAIGDHVGVPRQLPVFGQARCSDAEVKLLAYFLADGGTTQTLPAFTNSNPRVLADFTASVESAFIGVKVSRIKDETRTPTLRISTCRSTLKEAREAFAQKLNQLLRDSALSLHALGKCLGVGANTVHYWRTGKAVPLPQSVTGLCELFEIPASELLPFGYEASAKNAKNAVTVWLEHHALRKKAIDKAVPEIVFELPRSDLALFLNRLFTCDGSIYVQNHNQCGLSYCTASFQLAKDVQHLLLRFGILSTLRKRQVKYKDGERPFFELRVTHQSSIRTFIDEIGVFGKEQAVENVRAQLDQKQNRSNTDNIPADIWQYLLAKRGNRSWRECFESKGYATPSNMHVGNRGISRRRLKQFAEIFDDTYLHQLANSDLYWDKVVSIQYVGNKQVYDLTVPETHNFVAEDVLVHNTTFAMNIAEHAAIKSGKAVAVFSMEMPGESLALRMMSSLGRIDQHKVRTGKLDEDDWPRLTSAVGLLAEAKMFIDDTPGLSPSEMRARARRLTRESELGLIVIDYLQLMQSSGGPKENRATEISEISRSLKMLAKELSVPVIALSQLNRSLEQRPNKRPVMSDLRESGAIEQDADVIVFIYRDEVYNPDSPDKGTAEIIIGKQRNGPIGVTRLTFLGKYTRFENFIGNHYSDDGYE